MSIDESGGSIELNMCGLLFWRVSRDQVRHVLKDVLSFWGLYDVVYELVMEYAEPKWYAQVAVYDSLQEAGWLIETVRQKVLGVVLKLADVFGNAPVVEKELFRNTIGFWGRDFPQQTANSNNCGFHCNLLAIALSIGASPSQITAELGDFARDLYKAAFASADLGNLAALRTAHQALRTVLLQQVPNIMVLLLLPQLLHTRR